ncbi:glycosyltransferase family 2 protein, partial [Streptomyces alkaliphilus]|uniref:glycosyltransferase family 2 protein n=1 Tax=Streptomyces alkaliphilus TaxID=1472722 RepID=UPI00117D7F31
DPAADPAATPDGAALADTAATERPLVSVIIPNHNYARTLPLCLRAVAEQSYPRVEIVVVDDGSTDDSPRIAEEFPCTLVRTSNAGVSAARNTGVRHSTGSILFFLDSDIALRPDAVERAVDLLESDPRIGFVCGNYDDVPLIDDGWVERYKVLHGHHWRRRTAGDVRAAYFSLGAMPRAMYERAGPLDETLRDTEDVEYGARLAPLARVVLDPAIVGRHDDDDRIGVLLRKQYRRSVPLVALFADRHRARPDLSDTAHRPLAVAGTALIGAGLLGAAVRPRAGAATIGAGLGLFAVAERKMLRLLRDRAGGRALPAMAALHLMTHATTGAAALVGAGRWALSPSFRRRYRNPDTGTGTGTGEGG